jgi:DNA-binding transcriptional ArsR family regulator
MDDDTATPLHVPLEGARLKALAHPLRVQLLDALSTYGPATASALGERLGESSGATSYHLRQLEKSGFVREDAARGRCPRNGSRRATSRR